LTKLGYPPEKMRVIYNSVASSAPTERAGRYVRVLQEEFLALLITTGGWAKREESAIAPASVSSGWLRRYARAFEEVVGISLRES
jgi:hypothetical protein